MGRNSRGMEGPLSVYSDENLLLFFPGRYRDNAALRHSFLRVAEQIIKNLPYFILIQRKNGKSLGKSRRREIFLSEENGRGGRCRLPEEPAQIGGLSVKSVRIV